MALKITRTCDTCGIETVIEGKDLEPYQVTNVRGEIRVFVSQAFNCIPCMIKAWVVKNPLPVETQAR